MYVLTNTPKEFIPESQKNETNPLTFICVPPSRKTVLDTQEKILQSVDDNEELESTELPISDLIDLALDSCVVGWKNLVDADNKAIEFSKENFQKFNDTAILLELYSFIKELTEGNV